MIVFFLSDSHFTFYFSISTSISKAIFMFLCKRCKKTRFSGFLYSNKQCGVTYEQANVPVCGFANLHINFSPACLSYVLSIFLSLILPHNIIRSSLFCLLACLLGFLLLCISLYDDHFKCEIVCAMMIIFYDKLLHFSPCFKSIKRFTLS